MTKGLSNSKNHTYNNSNKSIITSSLNQDPNIILDTNSKINNNTAIHHHNNNNHNLNNHSPNNFPKSKQDFQLINSMSSSHCHKYHNNSIKILKPSLKKYHKTHNNTIKWIKMHGNKNQANTYKSNHQPKACNNQI